MEPPTHTSFAQAHAHDDDRCWRAYCSLQKRAMRLLLLYCLDEGEEGARKPHFVFGKKCKSALRQAKASSDRADTTCAIANTACKSFHVPRSLSSRAAAPASRRIFSTSRVQPTCAEQGDGATRHGCALRRVSRRRAAGYTSINWACMPGHIPCFMNTTALFQSRECRRFAQPRRQVAAPKRARARFHEVAPTSSSAYHLLPVGRAASNTSTHFSSAARALTPKSSRLRARDCRSGRRPRHAAVLAMTSFS